MAINKDLMSAAQALGAALRETPEIQEYLQAEGIMENDLSVRHLEAEAERVYSELVERQRTGETLFPQDVNRFYQLQETLRAHPYVSWREERYRLAKALCEQANQAMSSILSMDYTQLASKN